MKAERIGGAMLIMFFIVVIAIVFMACAAAIGYAGALAAIGIVAFAICFILAAVNLMTFGNVWGRNA